MGNYNYDWSFDDTERLNQMPLKELVGHMKSLIGAKLELEQLGKEFIQDVNQYTESFNQKVDQIDGRYEDFAYVCRHPNEEAYCAKHNGMLPQTKPIDYFRRTFSNRAIVLGIIMWIIPITRILGIPLLILGIIFHSFAKRGYRISQPIASLKNHLIVSKKNSILNADKKYCQDHDCSDTTLKEKFKYDSSLTPIYSAFTDQVKLDKNQAEYKLSYYSEVIRQNIVYFPKTATDNMHYFFEIYKTLLEGVPTWEKALRYVGQNQKIEEMKDTLTDAIKNATSEITQEIRSATSKVTSELKKNNEMLNNVAQETHRQTDAINYWNTVQTTMEAYQISVMNETRKNTETIAAQYRN
ncbi:hypothetical protein [Companilactobacillus bobalius]|uniref:Uncharacterized protein n=3 Tax=Companilactobacillus bobalius TaxID=2801451 RepID=A0A202F952_9LACO|nr:hypothetical protein [Companilactobacillus bobalius]KRK82355.1 hypothetical protein FC78_GL002361 [Companilactobacillus bobalius DSM 19674]OVE97024.1 hypothetical protein LKACC16343_02034 [Companilactobacillus bobalius]